MARMPRTRRALVLPAVAAGIAALLAASPARAIVRDGTAPVISAHLDRTSFTAAQSFSVTLTFHYAPAGTQVGYLLTLKKGAAWQTVRNVADLNGMDDVDNTRLVGQLFGSRAAIKAGRYRLKLFSAETSVTLPFTIRKAPTVVPGEATPRAGRWTGNTTASNFTTAPVIFTATKDHRHIVRFSFKYSWQVSISSAPYLCTVFGTAVRNAATPIAHKSFKVSGERLSFSGTFDSPIRAHGTVGLQGVPVSQDCGGTASLALVPWAATWEKAR